jgi:UDP-N-acetylglucosamine 2-epimerase
MIHVAIGTKAQFIKMMPIMLTLQQRSIDFNLIDIGQHALITQNLRSEFGLKQPDVSLSAGENVARLGQGLRWILRLGILGMNRDWINSTVFHHRKGVCLIHGDTVSTLVGLCLAKRAGLKVAHVEAGLRSFNIFEPFPEELVRFLAMRFADILYAPSAWARDNLVKMGYGRRTVLISSNTSMEAVFSSLSKAVDLGLGLKNYALVTVHRMENIFSRQRLEFVLTLIERIARDIPVVFVQHPPTVNQMVKFGLQERLERLRDVTLSQILSHAQFIHFLDRCEFVVTDGGSIQEESYYLGKPCLLLRKKTERMEGIGRNVVLGQCTLEAAERFIREYPHLSHARDGFAGIRPSQEIIDHITSLGLA